MMYYFLGDYTEAADHQRRALRLSDYDHRIWGRLAESLRFIPGKVEQSQSMYRSAVDAARERIASNPKDALAHARLGNFLSHLGRYDDAAEAFATARNLAPTSDQVPYMEATAWAARGNVDQTVRCLNEALARGIPPMFVERDPDIKKVADRAEVRELLAGL